MNKNNQRTKWRSCILLSSLLSDVEKFCKNEKNGFANPSQFIGFAVRKELDGREKHE